jgi:uncharacterized membrane protein YphA (DoxX/SURF4 family)
MKIVFNVVMLVLVLLAVSSGVTKISLMQQDVEFFGRYGFTDPLLIAFGCAQLVGGVLLAIPKTRLIGAIVVAITFVISAGVLFMEGKIPITLVTLVCVLLLALIAAVEIRKKQV